MVNSQYPPAAEFDWAASHEENRDVQNAIQASLNFDGHSRVNMGQGQDQSSAQQRRSEDKRETASTEKVESPMAADRPRGIDDCIADLRRGEGVEFRRLDVSGGDTWVFINPPSQQHDQSHAVYSLILARYSRPFVIPSHSLRRVHSPVFERLLGSTNQHRTLRRLGLVGRLPPAIKYVIDLTPPAEGDEALLLTMDLSCSLGVRSWSLSGKRWKVGNTLVAGVDEYTTQDPSTRHLWPATVGSRLRFHVTFSNGDKDSAITLLDQLVSGKEDEKMASNPSDRFDPVPEYTPLRHRLAIERVLQVIHGQDPKLDSAAKVFTTCAVAKHLQLMHNPLTDYVVRWLRAPPNSYFLEVLPEDSLKMADWLQCGPLCRDIFGILVGEAALDLVSLGNEIHQLGPNFSAHHRKKGELHEGYITRVEYARNAFVERVQKQFADLINVNWVEGLDQFKMLDKPHLHSQELDKARIQLRKVLKSHVRAAIYAVLDTNYQQLPGPVGDTVGGEVLFPKTTFGQVWTKLRHGERIFTRSFWKVLKTCCLDTYMSAEHIYVRVNPEYGGWAGRKWSAEALALIQAQVFTAVNIEEVRRTSAKYLQLVDHYAVIIPTTSTSSSTHAPDRTLESTWTVSGPSVWPKGSRVELPYRPIHTADGASGSVASARPGITGGSAQDEQSLGGTPNTLRDDEDNAWSWVDKPISPTERLLKKADGETLQKITGILTSLSAAQKIWQIEGEKRATRFDLFQFLLDVVTYFRYISDQMLATPDTDQQSDPLGLALTDTLVCLNEDEMKFLPLWAGGNDDGTNGVFSDEVPFAEAGFSTSGPGIHHGTASSQATSEFDFLNDARSSLYPSIGVQDGISTVDCRDVHALGSAASDWEMTQSGFPAPTPSQNGDRDHDMTLESESTWDKIDPPSQSKSLESEDWLSQTEKTSGGAEESYDDVFDNSDEDCELEMDIEEDETGEEGVYEYAFENKSPKPDKGKGKAEGFLGLENNECKPGDWIIYKEGPDEEML